MGLGSVTFFAGLKRGPVSIVSPLSSTYPVVVLIVGVSLFGAPLTTANIVGIITVTVGVALAGGLLNHSHLLGPRPADQSAHRWRAPEIGPLLALVTALLWGAGYPLISQGTMLIGWKRATFLEFTVITALFAALAFAGQFGSLRLLWRALRSPHALACGAAQLLGVAALNIALADGAGHGTAVIATALSATYPAFTVIVALRHFQERVGTAELLGALTGIAGVIELTLLT